MRLLAHWLRLPRDWSGAHRPRPLVRSLQFVCGMTSPLKQILVATDFSEGSDEALNHAIEERIVQHAGCPVLTVPFGRKAV